MQVYEVEVETKIREFHLVKAKSPEEAVRKWQSGELSGELIVSQTPVSATEEFDQEDDDDDAKEDQYEDDPLHHGTYIE